MKLVVILFLAMFSSSAWAEHDATYCGKILSGSLGNYYGDSPEAVLAVDSRIEDGNLESWDNGYGALNGLTDEQLKIVKKAIKSSQSNGTSFCVEARWGGGAYNSQNINDIILGTDSISRIDYQSRF